MSETKRPFDDAIYVLGRYMDNRLRGKEAAIRVLEAAGKVDKGRAIRVLATLLKSYVESGDGIPELERDLRNGAVIEIRALLEALPDGGKK